MDEASKKNKEIEKIKKKLASMSLSPEERNNYEYRLRAIRDRLRAIRDEADAIEFATRKGLEQGQAQKTEEIVSKMLAQKLKEEDIIKFTGITKEELNEIKKKLQKQ